MKDKYKYSRLYDYCVENDATHLARGYIKRKYRIPLSIIVCVILYTAGIYLFFNHPMGWLALIFSVTSSIYFVYITRTGPITIVNILYLNQIIKKPFKNILEKYFIYINEDGNLIHIEDRHLQDIRRSMWSWVKLNIYFKDYYRNKYIIRITRSEICITLKYSKGYFEKYTVNQKKISKYYFLNDLNEIKSINEFNKFVKQIFLDINSFYVQKQKINKNTV